MSKIIIVIPCFNEETRLPVQDYRRFLFTGTADLYFVNDGSTDQTSRILLELKNEFSAKVQILELPKNVGKAEAVRRGILAIDVVEKRDIIGFIDADLSTPFEEIEHFISEFNDTRIQFVFGSRISRIGASIKRFHHRHYFGRIVATIVSLYLGIPIYDSQCGAKFFHAGLARKLFLDPFVSRWLFDVEIFRRFSSLNMRVTECSLELPLHTWIEKGGSKINLKDYLNLPFEFYKILRHYLHKKASTNNAWISAKTLISLEPHTRTYYGPI